MGLNDVMTEDEQAIRRKIMESGANDQVIEPDMPFTVVDTR
jgi:hypothetical protein